MVTTYVNNYLYGVNKRTVFQLTLQFLNRKPASYLNWAFKALRIAPIIASLTAFTTMSSMLLVGVGHWLLQALHNCVGQSFPHELQSSVGQSSAAINEEFTHCWYSGRVFATASRSVDCSFAYILGSSFSIGGILAKVFFKRFFCAGVNFFAGEAGVRFFEEALGLDFFLGKKNPYIDVLSRLI